MESPYVKHSLLGRGGFGEVWKARDEKLQRWVALKVLKAHEPEDLRRFQREAQTAASLSHPNIAAIYEVGPDWIAMQLVEGAPPSTCAPREAARIVRDATRAVAFAHRHGVVHRDLKPANLMVEGPPARLPSEAAPPDSEVEGRRRRVYVMDFGLARTVKSTLTQTGMMVGTPAYMSPEQVRGERATEASDVWSLGATLHELVSGRPPFEAAGLVELLAKILADDPAPLPGELGAIASKCLERDPSRRYASAAALADDLDRFLAGEAPSARPSAYALRAVRRVARHRAAFAVLAAGVVVAAAVSAAVLPRLRATERELARRERLQRLTDVIARTRPLLYTRDIDIRARLAEVEAALAELETVEPKDAEIWTRLGMGWYVVGDVDRAERALTEGERLAPDDERVTFHLGRIWFERGLMLRAGLERGHDRGPRLFALYRRAAAILKRPARPTGDPVDREAAAAYAAYVQGQDDECRRLCDAGASRPGSPLGREEFLCLKGLLSQGRDREAALDRALQLRPHYPLALAVRASERAKLGDVDGAFADYAAALSINPRYAMVLLNRCNLHLIRGDVRAARADADTLVRASPRLPLAYAARSNVRLREGDTAGALEDADEALRLSPDPDDMRFWRARALEATGAWELAVAEWDALIRHEPKFAGHYVDRANARCRVRDYAGTVADCDAALRLQPDSAEAHANRGQARRELGDAEGARRDLGEAVRLAPDHAGIRYLRADLRRKSGDLHGALEDYDAVIRADPKHVDARTYRGLARRTLGDAAGALEDLDEAVRLAPANPAHWSNRGLARQDRGEHDAAIADFSRAIELAPQHAAPHYNRGRSRQARGDLKGAIADYDEAIRLRPDLAEYWANRAEAKRQDGDLRGAIADYDRALAKETASWALSNRGLAKMALGDTDGAHEDYTLAIQADPKNEKAWNNRGLAKRKRGDVDGAIADYTEAIRLAPRYSYAYMNRGLAWKAKGERDSAAADFERALETAPAAWPERPRVERLLAELKR